MRLAQRVPAGVGTRARKRSGFKADSGAPLPAPVERPPVIAQAHHCRKPAMHDTLPLLAAPELPPVRRCRPETPRLTGDAPEPTPGCRTRVRRARRLGLRVIDRCQRTLLTAPGQETLARWPAQGPLAAGCGRRLRLHSGSRFQHRFARTSMPIRRSGSPGVHWQGNLDGWHVTRMHGLFACLGTGCRPPLRSLRRHLMCDPLRDLMREDASGTTVRVADHGHGGTAAPGGSGAGALAAGAAGAAAVDAS